MRDKLFLFLALLASVLAAPRSLAAGPDDVEISVKIDWSKPQTGYVDFRLGGEQVTRYHMGHEAAKPYFWPLNAPGGVPVTRAWPMEKGQKGETVDHVHQKSAWFCHGDVIPEGIERKQKIKGVEGVDFWSEAPGHGRIVCTHVGAPETAPGWARVATRNEWRTADGTKILDEARVIGLHRLGEARLLVLDVDLHASVCPITFGDTKEGSLGVRVNDVLREAAGQGKLENAEGKTGEKLIWGQVSKWCDYSGPVGGKTVGIAILDGPNNPHPAAWHSRGYGLTAANPFGRDKSGFPSQKGKSDLVRLAKGEHLKLRYGILVHAGDAKEGKVAECYEEFVKLRERVK